MIQIGESFFNCDVAHPLSPACKTAAAFSNIGSAISTILPNLLVGAGVIFFLLILGGGFMMIKSAGGDANAQDTAKAKNAVTFALVGFLLVITAYFILQIVGVITGVNFISPPPL